MCHKITCNVCHKPTWEGCGDHIDYALHDVPVDDRCHCKAFQDADRSATGGSVSSW